MRVSVSHDARPARVENVTQNDDGPALVGHRSQLALSGFAALGMEMLWLRHLAVLLGGFRAVLVAAADGDVARAGGREPSSVDGSTAGSVSLLGR